jgi:hypothetical protein
VAIVPPSQSSNSQIQTLQNFSGYNQVLDLQPAGATIILSGQTTAKSNLTVVGNIIGSGTALTNLNYNAITNKPDLSVYATSANLSIISNNKQDTYTSEREYPPKLYNAVSLETTSTLLKKSVFTQKITLNTTGITYGSGDYVIYSSSQWTAALAMTQSLVRSLLFDYTDDVYGAH